MLIIFLILYMHLFLHDFQYFFFFTVECRSKNVMLQFPIKVLMPILIGLVAG